MLVLESGGGQHIFQRKTPRCEGHYEPGGPVTEDTYRAYLARRDECGTTGVGATQLTWAGFQDLADERGGCWRPEINCQVGFEILAGYIERHGFEAAFAAYNTGSERLPTEYSDRAMALLPTWQAIVAG